MLPPPAYRAPPWLPGSHAQTIYPLLRKPPLPSYRRERWETPDGDFIDLDWTATPGDDATPLVVLFHGLEGSARSHYARALMLAAAAAGWQGVVPHFRGCSGELNRLPRAYHSGDSAEIDWVLKRLRNSRPQRRIYVVGVSLGGNALLKWLGEQEFHAARTVDAAAAVCAPADLAACGQALARAGNRLYTWHFLASLKTRARQRLARHPGLFKRTAMETAHTLYAFDDAVTAPVHGFLGVDDYYARASARPLLRHVRLPTLMINPGNDPFLPPEALPASSELSGNIRFESPRGGGHVGFVHAAFPGQLDWLPQRLLHFFQREI